MSKLEFCKRFIFLKRKPILFDQRPYLPQIYSAQGNLVICASRQVEKSTFLANSIIYEAVRDPNAQIVFVCPREAQARTFSHWRLLPALKESPAIRRLLLGKRTKIPVNNIEFSNGANIAVRSAFHNADGCRGLSATMLVIDEFQDLAPGSLPVLQEMLSHAEHGRIILSGTPKTVDNHLSSIFRQSTANEWTLTCPTCGNDVILDERCLGPTSIVCPKCQTTLETSQGRWVSRNPGATWGQGFRISAPMVPWGGYSSILERQRDYDPVQFKNEVLGLPTTLGDHIVTLQELEDCCSERAMASPQGLASHAGSAPLIAGVDWGGGVNSRTVLVIGRMRSDFVFEICFIEAFQAREEPNRIVHEIAQRCRAFGVVGIAADGAGNGHVYNRLLENQVQLSHGFYAISYSTFDQEPFREGVLTKWTVGRSATIGVLFGRVKHKKISFPRKQDVGRYLDEFACETTVYDSERRAIRYTKPDSQLDDTLHATNYALLIATRNHNTAQQFVETDGETDEE